MAERLTTPIDDSTGIPFPIYPNPDLPPVIHPPIKNYERLGDWHHPFHPREGLVQGSLGQVALRNCRMQWTGYREHHDGVGYHSAYVGPKLPEAEEDLFRTVTFAAAKFIPDKALAFAPDGEASIVGLDLAGRNRLLQDGVIIVANRISVRDFMLDYLARNGGLFQDQKYAVEEFLDADGRVDKRVLGAQLIHLASRAVTAPIEPEYRQAKVARMMPAQRSTQPAAFVANFLLKARHTDDTKSIQVFEKRLRLAS